MSSHVGVSDLDRLPPIARATTRAEWAALIGIWAFFVIRSIEPVTHSVRTSGIPTPHWPIVLHTSFEVFLWILATPLVFAALDRTPVMGGVRLRHLAMRLVLAAVATLVHAVLSRGALFVLITYMGADPRLGTTDVLSWQSTLGYSLEGFMFLVIAHVVIQRVHRSRYRQRHAAELAASLARARLHALSKELQPHFLFNTLNGIAALVREDPRTAEAMLVRLGDLLRLTLDEGTEGEICLRAELERLDLYLDLQQMRFGPRLVLVRDIAPDVLQAQVPAMLLQPLIENALTHGIGLKPGPGEIGITARLVDGRLRITVQDTGPGLPSNVRESTGLGNTRARLAAMFSGDYRFELETRPDREGTLVTIEIPFRMARHDADGTPEPSRATTGPPKATAVTGAVA